MEERPTALFSSNNLMTIGCMKALEDLKWKLGSELSFIGFDDVDIATFLNAKLSVVARPMNAIGEIAFQLFIHSNEPKISTAFLRLVKLENLKYLIVTKSLFNYNCK